MHELIVGLPSGQKRRFSSAIIPNSQLLAVPYPYCDPRNWELQLDLQTGVESYVAVALAGVLILLGSVIVCLEARDNFSDANEKRRMATAMPL